MSAAVGTKVDCQSQAFDDMLAYRLACMERAPGRVVGAGEDVRFQGVDRLAVAETKEPVFQEPVVHSQRLSTIPGRAT